MGEAVQVGEPLQIIRFRLMLNGKLEKFNICGIQIDAIFPLRMSDGVLLRGETGERMCGVKGDRGVG